MPRRKHGAQARNSNALSHGLFRNFSNLDRRLAESKAIDRAEQMLCAAIGKVSPQESVICRQIVIGCYRLSTLERLLLGDQDGFRWDHLYMRWAREVREGLKAIGLDEREPPMPSLQEYLRQQSSESPR
jgi:hypothetical protein